MRYLMAFPMMLIALVVYNLVVFSGHSNLGDVVWQVSMMSGAVLPLTVGDLIILLALALVFVEVMKAARIDGATILDHILSTIIFVAALVEFLLVPEASTAEFLMLVVISFIDVVAGYSISIRAARRDFSIGGGSLG